MKVLIALLFFLIAPGLALGASATAELSWAAPTDRQDGTPLQAADIGGYTIYYAVDTDGGIDTETASRIEVEPGQASKVVELQLEPRPEPYVVAFAIDVYDSNGLRSPLSDIVTKSFEVDSTSPPGMPTSITIEITCGEGCSITPLE